MSTTNPQNWQAIRESLSESLRRSNPAASPGLQSSPAEMPHVTLSLGADLTYLGAVLEAKSATTPLLRSATVTREHDRLIVSLPTELLFAPVSSEIRSEALPAISTMANILNTVRNEVAIEGHAGAVGGGAGEYEANWQLSLSRAVAVAEALRAEGFTGAVLPMGRGDGDQAVTDAESKGEQTLSRRVDIVIRSVRSAAPPGGSLRPRAGPAAIPDPSQ